jgi:hypothetical protein
VHNTRRELIDDFVLFVSDQNDDQARSIAEGCLARALTTIWLALPWRVFRSPEPWQLTLEVNRAKYALPDIFGRIGPGEVRNLTRGTTLTRFQDGEREQMYPMAGTSLEIAGAPSRYEIVGATGAHTQPATTGEELEALSSDSGDTDVVVSLAGEDPDRNWTRAQVTLNGTTPVSLGEWAYVDELGKAFETGVTAPAFGQSSRGTILIRTVADETEIQSLFPQESARQHDVFAVSPKPASADVLALPIIRKPKRLFDTADTLPDLWGPALFEEMMIDWQVNGGEMPYATALQLPRPHLLRLMQFENQQKARPQRQPFGVSR